MIVPGLDRVEGTAVSPQLLDSDQLWHEHTTEVFELFEKENEGKPPEEMISMVEFCSAFATGARSTLAMRRAMARKDWCIDQNAVRLREMEEGMKVHSAQRAKITEDKAEGQERTRRRRNKGANQTYIARVGTKAQTVQTPGIVLAVGASYPYHEQNEDFRKALTRFRTILTNEGFYVTPNHACHVTIATFQKYSDEERSKDAPPLVDVIQVRDTLSKSAEFTREVTRGPFLLTVDRIDIPPSGNTVVILFKDEEGRINGLRQAIKTIYGNSIPILQIPSIVHTSAARVASFPACSRQTMLQRLEGLFEGLKVTFDGMDLVLEDREPYFSLFPDGGVGHWEFQDQASSEDGLALEPNSINTISESQQPQKVPKASSILDNQNVIIPVSVALILTSLILAWWSG